jgi:hypothetical protein
VKSLRVFPNQTLPTYYTQIDSCLTKHYLYLIFLSSWQGSNPHCPIEQAPCNTPIMGYCKGTVSTNSTTLPSSFDDDSLYPRIRHNPIINSHVLPGNDVKSKLHLEILSCIASQHLQPLLILQQPLDTSCQIIGIKLCGKITSVTSRIN